MSRLDDLRTNERPKNLETNKTYLVVEPCSIISNVSSGGGSSHDFFTRERSHGQSVSLVPGDTIKVSSQDEDNFYLTVVLLSDPSKEIKISTNKYYLESEQVLNRVIEDPRGNNSLSGERAAELFTPGKDVKVRSDDTKEGVRQLMIAAKTVLDGQHAEDEGTDSKDEKSTIRAPFFRGGDAKLRALFSDKDDVEKPIFHAINHLLDLLREDEDYRKIWGKTMDWVESRDSTTTDGNVGKTRDEESLQGMMGGSPRNLRSLLDATESYLRDILYGSGSSMRNVSSTEIAFALRAAKEQGNLSPLEHLVSGIRTAINTKSLHLVAKEILEKREERLREKLGLSAHEPLTSHHLIAKPYYANITLDQIEAYLNGDRSDKVFTIEGTAEE